MPFRDVIAHGHRLQLLARAVARGTLPQSLLFSGPSGVGKRLIATALAQTLNCTAPVRSTSSGDTLPVDGCGQCSACTRIVRGLHPDVLIVKPRVLIMESAPNRDVPHDIDRIREVLGQVMYRPFEGGRRVIVFDDAERLTSAAQSALLKTLEEPPTSSYLVLVTVRADNLMPTVRSRCQHLRFGQLSEAEVVDVIARVGGSDLQHARAAAAIAGGSAARALAIVSDELVTARDAAVALLESVAQARNAHARLESVKHLVSHDKKSGKWKEKKLASLRQQLTHRFQALTSLLRDIELLAAGSDPNGLVNFDKAENLHRLSREFGGRRGVAAALAVDRALEAIEGNINPRVVAECLACQL